MYFLIANTEFGEQTYFKIKTHNGEMTGTFTEEDFITESEPWQLIKGKAIFTAEFTGKKEGNDTYSYEGWCGCVDGFRYRMKIACVPPPPED